MNVIHEGQCYVKLRSHEWHEYLRLKNELIWYPESSMIFTDIVNYIPYVKSIMTENPYLISCYDRAKVWIWDDGKWRNPDIQTFGASIDTLTTDLLGYQHSMAMLPYKYIQALCT